MNQFKYIIRKSLAVGLFAATFVVFSGTSAYAESGFANVVNNTLDSIEQFVKDSGLPDLKKKVWEENKLLIKPFFKTRYDLTSNVFKARDDDSDHTDNIWTFTPGFQWVFKSKHGVIGGAYEASFKYFSQFTQQNEQDQKFLVYANLFPTDKIYIRTSEKIEQQGAVAGSSAFKPVNYLDNTVNVVVGYEYTDKITLEVGYENFDRDFSNVIAERFSYNEDKWDFRAYYQLKPNLKAFSGVRLGQVDFSRDSSRDTFYYEFPIGLEGKLPYNVDFRAAVGLHHRNLEESNRNDITHIVSNISLSRTFNHDRTNIQGGFLRRDVESAFSTATTYDEKLWYGAVKHLFTPKVRGRANIYYGNRDFEERVFTGTRLLIGGTVFVTPPNQVKRDDDVFGFGIGFDYNVRKWLIFHVDYQYARRDSNISVLDYTENVLSLGTTIPL